KSLLKSDLPTRIYVYDNSPNIDEEAIANPFVFYVHDNKNPGVSKAYNEGAKFAKDNGKNWILLLDQDTQLPEDFLRKIEENIHEYPPCQLYAMRLYSNTVLLSPSGYRFK